MFAFSDWIPAGVYARGYGYGNDKIDVNLKIRSLFKNLKFEIKN